MSDASERVIAGVSLDLYVAVFGAVAEGFDLEQVLAHEGLDGAAWARAEAAWAKAFMESAAGDLALVEEHDVRLLAAQERFTREVSPLDRDMRAWFDFMRTWSHAPEPMALLADLGLRRNDVFRLHRRWSSKLASDVEARAAAQAILSEPAGTIPALVIGPMVLPDPVRPSRPSRAPAPVDAPTPSPASAPRSAPPPLDVDLPMPPSAPPSRRSSIPPESSRAPLSLPLRSSDMSWLPPPPSMAPAALSDERKLTLITYASLSAETEVFPSEVERAFAKYGLSDPATRARELDAWHARLGASDEERADFEAQRRHFLAHWRSVANARRR